MVRLAAKQLRTCLPGLLLVWLAACASQPPPDPSAENPLRFDSPYYGIRFLDEDTGRGVPLVEIETTHGKRYVSDSAGWVAIHPDDISNRHVYFHLRSHGYIGPGREPKFEGFSTLIQPGRGRVIPVHRENIAERLYRVTGEGIYHDSRLLRIPVPIDYGTTAQGGVYGQDSVVNALYNDKLFWFWGDTRSASSPVANFSASGAVSALPGSAALNPDKGITLDYFVDETGFTRAMCPIDGHGAVWLSGLMSFTENNREKLYARYSRQRELGNPLELGIVLWNDENAVFDKVRELPLDTPLYAKGHPIKRIEDGETWFYFGDVIPNMRVRATSRDILDSSSYEAFTCLPADAGIVRSEAPLERDSNGQPVCGWKKGTQPLTAFEWFQLIEAGQVQREEYPWRLVHQDSQSLIIPHAGSVSWNSYRRQWVLITGEMNGSSSLLGEVWYAEGPTPLGPWSNVRKVVSHHRYSFYNVKQHPYFAEGPYIYFEGTYTKMFSRRLQGTPRYDYNQVMYRLDLSAGWLGESPPANE